MCTENYEAPAAAASASDGGGAADGGDGDDGTDGDGGGAAPAAAGTGSMAFVDAPSRDWSQQIQSGADHPNAAFAKGCDDGSIVGDAAAFEPCAAFAGARAGFVYTRGERGLGYYADGAKVQR